MVQERNAKAKIVALALTVAAVALCLVRVPASSVGTAAGAPLFQRLVYPFFHVNILHAGLNAWTMLCVVFYYDVPLWKIMVAYLIAVSFPADILSSPLTVGLSGVCFALMGEIAFNVRRRLYWQVWVLGFIALGFMLPKVNAVLHLYCYLAGCVIGLLDMPVRRWCHGK